VVGSLQLALIDAAVCDFCASCELNDNGFTYPSWSPDLSTSPLRQHVGFGRPPAPERENWMDVMAQAARRSRGAFERGCASRVRESQRFSEHLAKETRFSFTRSIPRQSQRKVRLLLPPSPRPRLWWEFGKAAFCWVGEIHTPPRPLRHAWLSRLEMSRCSRKVDHMFATPFIAHTSNYAVISSPVEEADLHAPFVENTP